MRTFTQWLENFNKQLDAVGGLPIKLQYVGADASKENLPKILSALETLDIKVPPDIDPVRFAAMIKRVAIDMLGGQDWRQQLDPKD